MAEQTDALIIKALDEMWSALFDLTRVRGIGISPAELKPIDTALREARRALLALRSTHNDTDPGQGETHA